MKDTKSIVIVILVIVILFLGYMLLVVFPEKAEAECQAGCALIVEAQVMNAVEECMAEVTQCYEALEQMMQAQEVVEEVVEESLVE